MLQPQANDQHLGHRGPSNQITTHFVDNNRFSSFTELGHALYYFLQGSSNSHGYEEGVTERTTSHSCWSIPIVESAARELEIMLALSSSLDKGLARLVIIVSLRNCVYGQWHSTISTLFHGQLESQSSKWSSKRSLSLLHLGPAD